LKVAASMVTQPSAGILTGAPVKSPARKPKAVAAGTPTGPSPSSLMQPAKSRFCEV
jgi:hypothetical protein